MKRISSTLVLLGLSLGMVSSGKGSGRFVSQGQDVQGNPATDPASRGGISCGMGVSYVSAADIVNRINALASALERQSDFKAAAEFFGAVTVPLSNEVMLKIEYAYLLSSYNLSTPYGPADFSFSVHMPTVIGQYVLMEAGVYNVRAGIGVGYHFGSYTEKYSIVDSRLAGKGPGAVIDLEANTAFGEDFFGYIGGNIRWEFIGTLSDGSAYPGSTPAPTLHFFSAGVRLGFTWYL